jgi:hypothetical protein
MKMHRIDYKYRNKSNAYYNAWSRGFSFVKADSIENAIAQFKQEWRYDLTDLTIIDYLQELKEYRPGGLTPIYQVGMTE